MLKKIKALKEVFIDYDLQKDELTINDKNGVYPYTFELKKFIREIKNKYNSKLYNEICKINHYKKELLQEIKKKISLQTCGLKLIEKRKF